MLDNAADADQVRPLLPGNPACPTLITSREPLVALDGARRFTLEPLADADARLLLAGILGGERVTSEPAAVGELVTLCGRLPLALRLAAANLGAAPGSGVAAYNAAVHAHGRLRSGPADLVRAAFELCYARLDPRARRLFRLLSLVPGTDFPAEVAETLLGDPGGGRVLVRLVTANLVAEPVPGRFQFHDLLREYATERAMAEEGERELAAALSRLRRTPQ
ncbi:hypothetical protein JYK18_03430 [Amycolatopsis sp. 195334CR]|nr:hypothetical protein [Amycolatopsis sp. 195334CR]